MGEHFCYVLGISWKSTHMSLTERLPPKFTGAWPKACQIINLVPVIVLICMDTDQVMKSFSERL